MRAEDGSVGTIIDGDNEVVAVAQEVSATDRITGAQARRANAALIVRAVNAHDDLVAALKHLTRIAMADGMRTTRPDVIEECLDALAKAEAHNA